MYTAVKQLLSSKKFLVMLAGVFVAVLGKVGVPIDPDLTQEILAMCAAFVVGQGIADHGKEAAKVTAGNVPL